MADYSRSQRDAVVPLLARGLSPTDVARELGLNERTVRRWRSDPEVAAEVSVIRRAITEETVGALTEAVRKAVDTLTAALGDESAAIRVRAAAELVRAFVAVASHAELEQRIAALETRLEGRESPTCLVA